MASTLSTTFPAAWKPRQSSEPSTNVTSLTAQPILAYSSALVHADAALLQGHEHEIMGLEALDPEARDAIGERIWFLSRPPAELWGDLEEFCQKCEGADSVPTEAGYFACRLVEAL